ncbi:MAG: serine/threonine-protein kinase, partial [Acidobacteriia bacterium]|nr:serine/threonine-protein kinase [Terriglobia bacterium]
ERRARFEREAKLLASLNHPNVATLHALEDVGGTHFLAMELVEGEGLDVRIARGAIPIEEALPIALQVAEGLEAAHEKGIVHRDLKPGNVKVRPDGTVKVLDFGLAKAWEEPGATSDLALSPTITGHHTRAGVILGTAAYMSPEQARGKPVDKRADIWAFGCLLYEMLTGRRLFVGETISDTLAAVLKTDPDWTALPEATPASLRSLLHRCLDRDVKQRLRDIGEARVAIAGIEAGAPDPAIELEWTGGSGGPSVAPAKARDSKSLSERLAWLLCCVLAAGGLTVAILWRTSTPAEQTMYFSAPFAFAARDIAIAPNGHTVAVVGYRESARKNVIWLYEVGSPEARSLAGTEGASFPFWSPDGRFLAFFADGKLKKTEVAGGPVQTLCDAPSGRGGTWNKDAVIVFAPSGLLLSGLYRISASGGTPTRISTPDASRGENTHRWPMFMPDGRHYLYLAANVTGESGPDAIFIGLLDSNEKRFVVKTSVNAAYAAGNLLFYRDRTLFCQNFDLDTFELTGEPKAILTEIQYLPRIARTVFAVSDHGLLLAQKSSEASLSRLTWFDRKGNELGVVGTPDLYSNVVLARNGESVAVDKTDQGSQNTDVWTYDLQRDSMKRLTFDPAIDAMPVWSPNGARLMFSSSRQHVFDVYVKNADGAQEEQLILHSGTDDFPNDWSRDGKYVLYIQGRDVWWDLWYLSLPELKSSLFLKTSATIRNGQFSPDAKWVAYASNETGKWEIYVTSFPQARGKWQVSAGGGEQPRWRGDGKELFFLSPEGKMMAVPVKTGAGFDADAPVSLFQANAREIIANSEQAMYDVDRSGQRFLINTQVKKGETQPLSAVLNWDAGLKR